MLLQLLLVLPLLSLDVKSESWTGGGGDVTSVAVISVR